MDCGDPGWFSRTFARFDESDPRRAVNPSHFPLSGGTARQGAIGATVKIGAIDFSGAFGAIRADLTFVG